MRNHYPSLLRLLFSFLLLGVKPSVQAQTVRRWDWAQSAGAPGIVVGVSACESASGNLYVVGQADASGSLKFGNIIQGIASTQGKSVGIIATYSTSGTPLQIWQLGQGGTCTLRQVQVDSQGYLYVLGTFAGTCTFGNAVLTNASTDFKPFVAKVAPWGTIQWAVECGSQAYDPMQLVLTPTGKLLVSYTIMPGSGHVGTYVYNAPNAINNSTGTTTATIFAQLNVSGTLDWATKFDDPAALIVPNKQSGYYACGRVAAGTPTDPQLIKLDGNGQVVTAVTLSGVSSYSYKYSLTTDQLDNAYLSSNFGSTLRLGTLTLNAGSYASGDNGFIAKFNSALTPQWATNTLQTQQRCLIVAPSGAIYQVGEHQQTLTYGTYSVPYTATSPYDRNLYALRLSTAGVIDAACKIGTPNTSLAYDNAVLERNGNLTVSWQEFSTSNTWLPHLSSLTPSLALSWQQSTAATGQLLAAINGGTYQCGQLTPPYSAGGLGYPGWRLYVHQYTTTGIKAWEEVVIGGQPSLGFATAAYSGRQVFTASSARGVYYSIGRGTFGTDPYRSDITRLSALPSNTAYNLTYLSSDYRDAQATAVAVGSSNLVAATGYFTGTGRTWGNTPPYPTTTLITAAEAGTTTATPDAFIAQYDTALSLRWIRQLGGPAADKGSGVVLDAAGCTYAVGTFTGTGTFLGTTLASAGALDGYLVKLDPSGALLWAVRYGGTGSDEPSGVTLGKNGELYVSGRFTGTAGFGNLPVLTSRGGYDAFLARFDAATGAAVWAQPAGGSGDDAGIAVAVTASGSVVLAGSFSGTAWLGPAQLTVAGGTDAFLAAYLPTGTGQWAHRYGGSGNEAARAITGLAGNKLAMAGQFQGTLLLPMSSLSSQGGLDGFIATLDSTGTVEQAWDLGGPGEDLVNGLSADANGNLYVAGAFTDSLGVGSMQLRSRSFAQNAFYARLAVAHTWTGAVSQSWVDSRNWSDDVVPTSADDVLLPMGVVRYPLLTAGTVQTGALTLATGASLTLSGGTLEIAGALTSSGGTIQQTGGLVRLTGTTAQVITSTSGPLVLANLEVGPAGASLTGPLHIQQTLTVQGNLASNGQLTLLSSATGTAMVVNSSTGVVNGIAMVQRYVDPTLNASLGYRHFSSPVTNTTVADMTTSSFFPTVNPAYNSSATPERVSPFPTVLSYDETRQVTSPATTYSAFDKGWLSPADLSDALVSGKGYTVNLAGGQTIDFVGTLGNGDVPLSLTRGTGPDAGWNLIGNPYPSTLDWTKVTHPQGLDDAISVYQSTSQYGGAYRTYVNGIGNPTVALGQGFFVRVSEGTSSVQLTLTNSARTTDFSSNAVFQGGSVELRPRLQLTLQAARTSLSDATYVYFEEGSTSGVDAHYDAVKLPNPNGLNLATITGGRSLAISGLPLLDTAPVLVPLQVAVPQAGSYVLQVGELLNFAAGTSPYLRDNELGTSTLLTASTRYAFTLSSAAAPGRFALEFRPNSVMATAAQALAQQVQVYPNPARDRFELQLPTGTNITSLTLLNALGQVVHTQAGHGDHAIIEVPGLATGVYLLRIQTATTTLNQRVVLN